MTHTDLMSAFQPACLLMHSHKPAGAQAYILSVCAAFVIL